MSEKTSLMEFPCDFPIKIIGDHSREFLDGVTALVRQYYPDTDDAHIQHKVSTQGNFLSITATVHCLEQATLDALYSELSRYPGIRMVL